MRKVREVGRFDIKDLRRASPCLHCRCCHVFGLYELCSLSTFNPWLSEFDSYMKHTLMLPITDTKVIKTACTLYIVLNCYC